MTFDPSKPQTSQSPALFPAQNQTNMNRLQTLFGVDHQFNDTSATNDGWHKVIEWVEQSDLIDPLNPTANAPVNDGNPGNLGDCAITWEQQDSYNVQRVWMRQANAGNVVCLNSETEVRGTQTLTNIPATTFAPPTNTHGSILFYTAAVSPGIIQQGFWVNLAGTVYARTIVSQYLIVSVPAIQPVLFSGSGGNLQTSAQSGFTGLYSWRAYYRYL